MMSRLRNLLDKFDAIVGEAKEQTNQLSAFELQLATAALMVEIAVIDQHLDQKELNVLASLLEAQFDLSSSDTQELINDARTQVDQAASLHQFTTLINQHCQDEEKYQLACHLWRVAYADGNIDKYEEHMIRRISDLIYLRHSEFIRAKHQARDE